MIEGARQTKGHQSPTEWRHAHTELSTEALGESADTHQAGTLVRWQPAETGSAVGDLQDRITMVPTDAHLDAPAVGHGSAGVVHQVPCRPLQSDRIDEDAGPVEHPLSGAWSPAPLPRSEAP